MFHVKPNVRTHMQSRVQCVPSIQYLENLQPSQNNSQTFSKSKQIQACAPKSIYVFISVDGSNHRAIRVDFLILDVHQGRCEHSW